MSMRTASRNKTAGRGAQLDDFTRGQREKQVPPAASRSERHDPDFLFHFGGIHHGNGVPGAAVEEAAVGPFADALLTPDAKQRIHLDAAERRVVFVGDPEHAVGYRTVLD